MLKPKARISLPNIRTQGHGRGKNKRESVRTSANPQAAMKNFKNFQTLAQAQSKKENTHIHTQGKQLRHFATLLGASARQMAVRPAKVTSRRCPLPTVCVFQMYVQLLLKAISSECSIPALSTTRPCAIASGNQIPRQENRERHGRPEGQRLPPNCRHVCATASRWTKLQNQRDISSTLCLNIHHLPRQGGQPHVRRKRQQHNFTQQTVHFALAT